MAIIFRRTTRAGKPAKNWSIKFKNAKGKWATVAGLATKELTRQKALDLEQRVLDIKAKRVDPFEAPNASPLSEHVEAFRRHMEGKGNTQGHVDQTVSRLETIFEECGFQSLDALTSFDAADTVTRYLATRQDLNGNGANHYVVALKAFTRWAIKNNRLPSSPVALMGGIATAGDDARERRALSAAEFSKLIQVTAAGKPVKRLSGDDRAMLYLVAAYTGLRASELASLNPASFQLGGRPPCVVVRAAYCKNREPANQPIGKDLAKRLRRWLAGREGTLWPGKWWRRAAEMLTVDLQAAGIEYETEAGTCDFHALRVCYITSLARGGVHPAIAQKLARHSTVNLTLNVYTKLSEAEIQEGLRGLPALPRAKAVARTKCAPKK